MEDGVQEKNEIINTLADLDRELEKGKFILHEQGRKNMHVLEVVDAISPELKEAEINESVIMGKVNDAMNIYKKEIEAMKSSI